MKVTSNDRLDPIEEMMLCAFSNQDCYRLPVRMIYELTPDDSKCSVQIVVLCLEHSSDYKPSREVVWDSWLPTMNLEAEILMGNPSKKEFYEARRIANEGGPDALIKYYEEKGRGIAK